MTKKPQPPSSPDIVLAGIHFLRSFARLYPVDLRSVYLPLFTYVYPARLRSYSLMSTLFAYLYNAYLLLSHLLTSTLIAYFYSAYLPLLSRKLRRLAI